MYEKHFGLTSRPFGSRAEGTTVFTGARQTQAIASLQKGLGGADAVVTVTGPAGVGKTTLVNRALDTLAGGRTAARIGRMPLTAQDVVDLLMGGFGIKKSHQGSIRRYAAFRRMLQAQSENGIPVAVVIEDAQRLEVEALAEVEALTAADAGDEASANIILMGQPNLHDLLSRPELGRLKQRVRLRLAVAPLSLVEVQEYLQHAFNEVGRDYESIFDAGVADIIYSCSEGIPRIINSLCESALASAAEEGSLRVTTALMRRLASEAYGYDADDATLSEDMPVVVATEPVSTVAPATEDDIDWEKPADADATQETTLTEDRPHVGHDIVVESGSYPESISPSVSAADDSPVAETNPGSVSTSRTDQFAIPDLIEDTRPELPRLDIPDLDKPEDIPVLEAHSKLHDADVDANSSDIGSPTLPVVDKAVGEAVAIDEAQDDVEALSDVEDGSEDDESVDLDAVLSPEPDPTNVMRAIALDVDTIAENARDNSEAKIARSQVDAEPEEPTDLEAMLAQSYEEVIDESAPEPDLENDLPTLSDSMRVNVIREDDTADEAAGDIVASAPDLPDEGELLSASSMTDAESVADDTGEMPDIDALEAALTAAKHGQLASQNELPAIPDDIDMTTAENENPAPIPEITLDKAIAAPQKENPDFLKYREEIGSASSLEDISDVMAETLFGCEAFDQIAAEVVANPPKGQLALEPDTKPSPVKLSDKEMPSAANDASELRLEEKPAHSLPVPETPKVAASKSAPASGHDIPMNESIALRIDILNKMKANATAASENVELGEDRRKRGMTASKLPQPEPIEQQISTSITQTRKTLKLSEAASPPVEEKPAKKSGGLFSRFKKSS